MRTICIILCSVMILLCLVACTHQKISSGQGAIRNVDEWVRATTVPLSDNLGGYHHAVSTLHSGAQHYFDQGLVMSFAFNHAESVRSFRAAQTLDQNCAMCYWGEALALGPNINVTRHGQVIMENEAHMAAYTAIQKAVSLKDSVTEKERDYIDTLAVRYHADASVDRSQLDVAYMNAMRGLSLKYPDDDDAAALFAEAMMDTMPWNYWINPDVPRALTKEVIATLETVLSRAPNHPLALHLYIHAVEASSTPGRAESAADRLRNLVPSAGHLVHMPSHIYWRIGRYQDAAEANAQAIAVDENYIATCHVQNFYSAVYYPHNLHFLWAAYSMEGRSQLAVKTARKIAASIPMEMVELFPVTEFFKTIPLLALANFGQWSEILIEPQPPVHLLFSNGIWRYVRAVAYTKLGQLDAARMEYAALQIVRQATGIAQLDAVDYPATLLLQIADQLVQGEILMTEGSHAKAIDSFKAAVTIQSQLPYTEPPFWYYPIQLSLGKALLESGDGAQAENVYRENLKHYPKNGWALYGLMRALEVQGKDSNDIRAEFNQAWQRADVKLSASRF